MDTLAPESTRQNLRSQRLNLLTNEPHQRLESLVKSKEPFASRDNFARFVAAQYLFQHDLEPLYRNEALARLFPGLASRARDDAARADLADLGHPVPEGDQSVREADLSLAEALAGCSFPRFEAGRCVPVQEGRRARTRRELRRPPSGRTGRRPRARLEELRGDPRRHRAERGRRAPGRQGRSDASIVSATCWSVPSPEGRSLSFDRRPTSPTTIAPAWLPGFSVLRRRPGARTCGDP